MSKNSEITTQLIIPFVAPEAQRGTVVMKHEFQDGTLYRLSDLAQKIFFEVLAKMDSHAKADNQIIEMTARELNSLGLAFGKTAIYDNFHEAASEVLDLKVRLRSEDDKHVYKTSINVFRAMSGKYKKKKIKKDGKEKTIEVLETAYFAVSPDAAGYLTEITKSMRFTVLLVEHTRKLKKASSVRLYQLGRRHHWITTTRNSSSIDLLTEELMDELDYNGENKDWRNFKARVFEPAIREINAKSDLQCSYSITKRGRAGRIERVMLTFTNAAFFIPSNDPEAKAVEGDLIEKNIPQIDEGLKAMIRTQIPDIQEDVIMILGLYQKELVLESLMDYARQTSNKEINNPANYFIGIILNKAKDSEKDKVHRTTFEKLMDISWAENLFEDEL